MSIRSFLDRFVHPRIAAIALVGIVLWGFSFLIAAMGLAVRASDPVRGAQFFFVSGLVGVFGILILLGCAFCLLGLRVGHLIHSYWS